MRTESRLAQPEGIEVQDLGDRLRITRRWFWWTSVPLGLLALVWIGLTLSKYADNPLGNLAAGSRSWALYMVDRFGEKRRLIGAIPDWNQAQFIKQEIERFLDRAQSREGKVG